MTSSRSPCIEWGSLLGRLTTVAIKLFKQHGCSNAELILPGTGVSPEDLAVDATVEFFQGETVKWCPKDPYEDPFPLVVTVMRNNFIDLLRSADHQKIKLIEDTLDENWKCRLENVSTLDQGLSDLLNRPTIGFTEVEAKILAEYFYPFAEGNQDLIDIIEAVVFFKCRKRREIADLLDISPQEVTDRWEKLRYNYTHHHRKQH
jgi:hypothetical protein